MNQDEEKHEVKYHENTDDDTKQINQNQLPKRKSQRQRSQ